MGRVRWIRPKTDGISLGQKASKKLINSLTTNGTHIRYLIKQLNYCKGFGGNKDTGACPSWVVGMY